MSKIILSSLILFASIQFVSGQCTTTAAGFGNNTNTTMYNVLGSVQVVLNTNNTVTINLGANFSTAAGPDVRIFLVDRGALTNAQLKIPANFLGLPKLEMGFSPANGAASLTKNIPVGVDISSFDTVYFFCQAFSQFWDYSTIAAFTPSNCSVLKTQIIDNSKLQIFPNPASNMINIQLQASDLIYNVSIFNTLGSLVFELKNQNLQEYKEFGINQLSPGIYMIKITDSENKVYQKRFIKN